MTSRSWALHRTGFPFAAILVVLAAAGCNNGGLPFETEHDLEIAETTVPCWGPFPRECLLVRRPNEAQFGWFYDPIEGFEFNRGFRVRAEVARQAVAQPLPDGSAATYRLLRVRQRTASPHGELLERVDAAAARWLATRPEHYALSLGRLCFCPPKDLGPVRVEARKDSEGPTDLHERTLAVNYADGSQVSSEQWQWFPSVQGLFTVIRLAIVNGAHRLDVEFDDVTGMPRRVYIDHNANVADDEVEYIVHSVQPL